MPLASDAAGLMEWGGGGGGMQQASSVVCLVGMPVLEYDVC